MTARSRFRPTRRAVLAGAAGLVLARPAIARRAIPDDNLAYPVLITVKLKNSQIESGSGFYLQTTTAVYLVTAKHVLFTPPPDNVLMDAELELLSYSKDLLVQNRIVLRSTLQTLNNSGYIKSHPTKDVAVIKIGNIIPASADSSPVPPTTAPTIPVAPPPSSAAPTPSPGAPTTFQMTYVPGITVTASAESSLLIVARQNVKTYDQVLVGNDVILYGYPRSLVAPIKEKQLDPLRPLLRRGIVAGLNETNKTIILDCPVYRGNSGGPAIEIEPDGFNSKLLVIGVAVQFVPLVEGSEDFSLMFNSGYSVVEPMDAVLELVQ